jgi:hypothetical protein
MGAKNAPLLYTEVFSGKLMIIVILDNVVTFIIVGIMSQPMMN